MLYFFQIIPVGRTIMLFLPSSVPVQSSLTEYSLNPDYFYPPHPHPPGIVVMKHFQTS